MITNKDKNIAQWALEYAQKKGCQGVSVHLNKGTNTEVKLRNGKTDKLQQASEAGLSIALYIDGKYGRISTNRLEKSALTSFIEQGISSIQYLEKDLARTLPSKERYYQGGGEELEVFDTSFDQVTPDAKLSYAENIAYEVLGKDERILAVESGFYDGQSFLYHLTSNGFEGERANTWFSVSSSISIKGDGDARPSDGWYESSIFLKDLKKQGVGSIALERVLRKLGQKKIKSGKYRMILDPLVASRLVSPLIAAMNGNAIQQQNSFLLNKLGEGIGSKLFTLSDQPHLKRSSGARYFDGEGVATEPRKLFNEGVLQYYFIDTYSANKLQVEPTISSPSILILEKGERDLAGILQETSHGVFVTAFNGGNSNSSTGDFSFGIEGFLVENGQLTTPISEMNITGNLIDLWKGLVEVGNDPRLTSSWRIPTLVFDGVDFSGL